MKPDSDVAIVGAGPVGCFTALHLSKLGVNTSIFEEHNEIGVPAHCAGHLSIRGLRNLGLYPLPKGIVENTFSAANFYSPLGSKFSVRLIRPVTCAVNRELFDKFLAEKAEAAGTNFHMNTRIKSLIINKGVVRGVFAETEGANKEHMSNVIVDAEGISSRLLRQTGLASFNREHLVNAVETEVDSVENVEPDAVEVFLGSKYASGFYAWLIPRRDGTAKLGLATKSGNPKEILQRLMLKHPVASNQLAKAKITKMSFHPITLGGPIAKAYADGFLAVGDAASQVKPTTGGGVVFGLTCAKIASEVCVESIRQGNCRAGSLQLYQKRVEDALGFDVNVMLRIRKFLDTLSDEKLDAALRFCKKVGLDRTLRDVEEIDFQGQTLVKMLTKPAAYAALAYFFLLYLATNP